MNQELWNNVLKELKRRTKLGVRDDLNIFAFRCELCEKEFYSTDSDWDKRTHECNIENSYARGVVTKLGTHEVLWHATGYYDALERALNSLDIDATGKVFQKK